MKETAGIEFDFEYKLSDVLDKQQQLANINFEQEKAQAEKTQAEADKAAAEAESIEESEVNADAETQETVSDDSRPDATGDTGNEPDEQ